MLHVGTLGSILVVYCERITKLLREDHRLVWQVGMASIPTVLVGIPLKLYFGDILGNPLLAGFLLIGTGTLLLTTSRLANEAYQKSAGNLMTFPKAFAIGCAQALAVLPGLSRSGLTITAGIACRISPKQAATFSFLMAIPVIAGGGLLEIVELAREAESSLPINTMIFGGALACFVGILSLRLLLRWLDQGRFHWFAFWCIPFGLFTIAWHFLAT